MGRSGSQTNSPHSDRTLSYVGGSVAKAFERVTSVARRPNAEYDMLARVAHLQRLSRKRVTTPIAETHPIDRVYNQPHSEMIDFTVPTRGPDC